MTVFAVFGGLVTERIAAVGGAEDGASAGQDAADVFEGEFARAFGPDEPVEAVGDADDLPLIFQDGGLDRGADDRVEAGGVAASGTDADGADGHRFQSSVFSRQPETPASLVACHSEQREEICCFGAAREEQIPPFGRNDNRTGIR